MKELAEVKEGPVVAVQYPSTVDFKIDKTAKELEVKHNHLLRIDPDDKAQYLALKSAISEVKSARTSITKEEDAIKKPLNEFRAIVIKTGNTLREGFQLLEAKLKAEQKRVDDIQAERLEAQRRLWNQNLNTVQGLGHDTVGVGLEKLSEYLNEIENYDLGALDFGESLEDAELALNSAKFRITQAITQEKARIQFAEDQRIAKETREREQAEQKIKDDQAAAEKIEADKKIKEAEAEAERLRNQISEMESKKDERPADNSDQASHARNQERSQNIEPAPDLMAVFDAGIEEEPKITENDRRNVEDLIHSLTAINNLTFVFDSKKIESDVLRVLSNAGSAAAFLRNHI